MYSGIWLVVRTLLDYFRPQAASSRQQGSGVAMAGIGEGVCGGVDEGGARKEEGSRIIGAEKWLIAWSTSSWAALLYAIPHVFALLRQGVDAAMATFGGYLLFFALCAQVFYVLQGAHMHACTRDREREHAREREGEQLFGYVLK